MCEAGQEKGIFISVGVGLASTSWNTALLELKSFDFDEAKILAFMGLYSAVS